MIWLITPILLILSFYIIIQLYLRRALFGNTPSGAYLKKLESSPHFIKGRFRNFLRMEDPMSINKMPTLVKQNRDTKRVRRPESPLPLIKRTREDFLNTDPNLYRVTWFGHSALLLEIDGLKVLIDPMLGPYASPVPFTVKRFSKEIPIEIKDLPEIDLVVYSHDHYDHLDYKSVMSLKSKVKYWITPLGVAGHLRRWGIPDDKIEELDWWESTKYEHLNLHCTPTRHFSGRSFKDRDMTLWCSWVIQTDSKNFFFSSDSGYWQGFKEIGERFGPFDISFVECGQYNVLWKENHMMPEESLQAFIDLNSKWMVPIHWGAFSLAPHSWHEPVDRLLAAAEERNIKTISILRPGESIEPLDPEAKTKWW